jgi:hypothetical protein
MGDVNLSDEEGNEEESTEYVTHVSNEEFIKFMEQ